MTLKMTQTRYIISVYLDRDEVASSELTVCEWQNVYFVWMLIIIHYWFPEKLNRVARCKCCAYSMCLDPVKVKNWQAKNHEQKRKFTQKKPTTTTQQNRKERIRDIHAQGIFTCVNLFHCMLNTVAEECNETVAHNRKCGGRFMVLNFNYYYRIINMFMLHRSKHHVSLENCVKWAKNIHKINSKKTTTPHQRMVLFRSWIMMEQNKHTPKIRQAYLHPSIVKFVRYNRRRWPTKCLINEIACSINLVNNKLFRKWFFRFCFPLSMSRDSSGHFGRYSCPVAMAKVATILPLFIFKWTL